MKIKIYNTTRLDKTEAEWIQNVGKGGHYKASGGSKYNYTDEKYMDILKQSLPHRVEQMPFQDAPLTITESESLKKALEEKIKELLVGRKKVKYGRPTIHFLGEEIKLDILPTGENISDNFISMLYDSYAICEECLRENKPVYLSIVEEAN